MRLIYAQDMIELVLCAPAFMPGRWLLGLTADLARGGATASPICNAPGTAAQNCTGRMVIDGAERLLPTLPDMQQQPAGRGS